MLSIDGISFCHFYVSSIHGSPHFLEILKVLEPHVWKAATNIIWVIGVLVVCPWHWESWSPRCNLGFGLCLYESAIVVHTVDHQVTVSHAQILWLCGRSLEVSCFFDITLKPPPHIFLFQGFVCSCLAEPRVMLGPQEVCVFNIASHEGLSLVQWEVLLCIALLLQIGSLSDRWHERILEAPLHVPKIFSDILVFVRQKWFHNLHFLEFWNNGRRATCRLASWLNMPCIWCFGQLMGRLELWFDFIMVIEHHPV